MQRGTFSGIATPGVYNERMADAARKVGIGVGAMVVVGAVVLFATPFGKGVRDIWGSGAVQAAVAEHQDLTYVDKSSDENLASFSTALKLYQSSEGQYPDADKWMDAILPRMILNNLPKQEAEKKLTRPGLPPGGYGYAINAAAAGKYVGDLPKGTILVYESTATARNAHGDPKEDGKPGGRGVSIEGTPVAL